MSRRVTVILTSTIVLFVGGQAAAQRVRDFPTVDMDKLLRIVTTDAPGGMALDDAGNIYFSDQQPMFVQQGRIVMLRRGTYDPVTIREGLDKPGDIEMTPDGRGLVIAEEGGTFSVHYFGISVELRNSRGIVVVDCTVYARTQELGVSQGYRISNDGYYHVPNILVPAQTDSAAELLIECGSQATRSVAVTLGQPGQSELFGETVVNLTVP